MIDFISALFVTTCKTQFSVHLKVLLHFECGRQAGAGHTA